MRPSWIAGNVVATTLLLVLSACSGDDGDEPNRSSGSSDEASTAPSPSASPVDDESSPEPPSPPRATDSKQARTAFLRFVIDAWGYALRHNDPSPVVGLSPSRKQPCAGCAELQSELAKRREQGWYVDFPGAEVRRVEVADGPEPGTFLAAARIDIPASVSYFEDGSMRNTSEEHRGATFELAGRRDGKTFTLLGFRVG